MLIFFPNAPNSNGRYWLRPSTGSCDDERGTDETGKNHSGAPEGGLGNGSRQQDFDGAERLYDHARPGRQGPRQGEKDRLPAHLLTYRGRKLAIVEAKSDEKETSEGVEQAKEYASMMQIRYTYSTNGDEIYSHMMPTPEMKFTTTAARVTRFQ